MSASSVRFRKRLETLEHVQAPAPLGVLVVPHHVPHADWRRWVQEHASGRPVIVIPEKRWSA